MNAKSTALPGNYRQFTFYQTDLVLLLFCQPCLIKDFCHLITSEDIPLYLYIKNNVAVGFAQCQLRRDYVEGIETSPVGYLEGVYVEPYYRKRGYGKVLVKACEDWAKSKGCIEFASDCELHNTDSLAFHLHTGFAEANRIICFTKKLF